jgi:hypothetical protein
MANLQAEMQAQIDRTSTERGETVRSARRVIGAPRVQATASAAREERRPPSREQIEARQRAMSETRRPTKSLDVSLAEENPKTISVPAVAATVCGKNK